MSSATFTEIELDAFQEVGNIGSGNAATSLSQLLNCPVGLEVSKVTILPMQNLAQNMGFVESETLSLTNMLTGDLNGFFWFLVKKSDLKVFYELLLGTPDADDPSVVQEIGNIVGGNYLRALSEMLGVTINLEPPQFTSPIDSFLNQQKQVELKLGGILLVHNKLTIEDKTMDLCVSTVLEEDSLKEVLKRLGL